MLRFKKIKYDGSEITLVYTEQQGSELSDVSKVNKEKPHADLVEALARLCPDVLDVCELGDAWLTSELRVQSVSLSHSEKTGIRGAVVTALKTVKIANSPVVINTPHLTEDGESAKGVMPGGMWRRVLALEDEAKAYLNGKRAPKEQLDIEDAIEPSDDLNVTMRFGDGAPVETTLGDMRRATERLEALNAAGSTSE